MLSFEGQPETQPRIRATVAEVVARSGLGVILCWRTSSSSGEVFLYFGFIGISRLRSLSHVGHQS